MSILNHVFFNREISLITRNLQLVNYNSSEASITKYCNMD